MSLCAERRRAYALRLLQYVRDEAHRFAQHYHHIFRLHSTLGDELKSEGRKRKRKPEASDP